MCAAFAKNKRVDIVSKHTQSIPGPGMYDAKVQDKRRAPTIKFLKEEKLQVKVDLKMPTALTYDPDFKYTLKKEPSFSMGLKLASKLKQSTQLGPGKYQIKDLPHIKRKSKLIGRSKSFSFSKLDIRSVIISPKYGFKGKLKNKKVQYKRRVKSAGSSVESRSEPNSVTFQYTFRSKKQVQMKNQKMLVPQKLQRPQEVKQNKDQKTRPISVKLPKEQKNKQEILKKVQKNLRILQQLRAPRFGQKKKSK